MFYPNPKGDKRNFKLISVQQWDAPHFFIFKTDFQYF
jgi:hypothetical protein